VVRAARGGMVGMGLGSAAAASADLVLKAACERCGAAKDLYGTSCRHTTLCTDCGRAEARARRRCAVCAAPVTRLIRVPPPRRLVNAQIFFFASVRAMQLTWVSFVPLTLGIS
jgi:transcription initiation factor TFIIF subunit alpha